MSFWTDLALKYNKSLAPKATTTAPLVTNPTTGVSSLQPKTLTVQQGGAMTTNTPVITLQPKTLTGTGLNSDAVARQQMQNSLGNTDRTSMASVLQNRLKANALKNSTGPEVEYSPAATDKTPAVPVTTPTTPTPESTFNQQAIDYNKLIEQSRNEQKRNAAVNTAQTRSLAQEQAFQAGAGVGSADSANYVNRALASADAANLQGAQGLNDTILSYAKSQESQQNWEKQFNESSKQADLSNERARYDQIISAIGSDNPEALSYFAKQYLSGTPIDQAYAQTAKQGFTAKTAKDKAYEEAKTWQPEIDQYLNIQKTQGQAAADDYLSTHPVPTNLIPKGTASNAAITDQAVISTTNFANKYSSIKDQLAKDPSSAPLVDIKNAYESGNKDAINSIEKLAVDGKGFSEESNTSDKNKTVTGLSAGSFVKSDSGNVYYVSGSTSTTSQKREQNAKVYVIKTSTLVDVKTGKTVTVKYKYAK